MRTDNVNKMTLKMVKNSKSKLRESNCADIGMQCSII